ncbi:MAG TPA: phage holin family protein [Thermoanaerobaculia bacterium]|nr:phage holin family protein [Thermoanaerobaculia bacterium]
MEEPETPEPASGSWGHWKRAAAAFARSARSLASLRWQMFRREAGAWAKGTALRVVMLVVALTLTVLASALLVAGLVAALYAWWGTLVGAIFAVFGVCVLAAAGLAVVAWRGMAGPSFPRTAEELRRDFDAFTGPES